MKILLAFLAAVTSLTAVAQRNIASFSNITATQALNGKVYFTAQHDQHGSELFVSDGTAGNYRLLKDISPGANNSTPDQLTVFNNQVFFVAYDPELGLSLWKTDGTTEGTQLVYGVEHSEPSNLIVFKDKLYFTTALGQLMRTDGTPGGVEEYYQSPYTWGRITAVVPSTDYLYFTYDGRTIIRDNGSSRISFLAPLSWEDVYYRNLFVLEDQLVVIKSSTYDTVLRIYALGKDEVYDGREDEWPLIRKIDAPIYGSHELENLIIVGGKLFFTLRADYDNLPETDQLWICDGTEAGTRIVKSFGWERHSYQSGMRLFFNANNRLFFRGGNTMGKGLWTSDGTEAGTYKVHDITLSPHADDKRLVLVDKDKFYFSGGDEFGNAELWVSNGTATGTNKMLDLEDEGGSTPHFFSLTNDLLYFVTSRQFSATLWSSFPVADITVSHAWGSSVPSGATISPFSSTDIGACTASEIIIHNKGLDDLFIGDMLITGRDFYLENQSVPEKLAAGQSITLKVVFNPVNRETSRGTITILSNDIDEPRYVIHLRASPSTKNATQICQFTDSEYVKNLAPGEGVKTVTLSNSSVTEGLAAGTVIGEFTLPGSTATAFSFTTGEGDEDNGSFTINGNVLKSNIVFSFDARALYSLRVKAVSQNEEVEESFRIRVVNQSFASGSAGCRQMFERMDFSYKSLNANSQGYLFSTTSDGRILRSTDGGNGWHVVYKGVSVLHEVIFKNHTGYAWGESVLLKSEDDGATWVALYIPFSGQSYFYSLGVSFLTEKNGFVSSDKGEVLFTDDGGQSWSQRLAGRGEGFRNIFFITEDTGFGIDSWGVLLKTIDGGRSWSFIDLSSLGWSSRARNVWFVNETDGFLTTDNKLYESSNGGTNWTEVTQVPGVEMGRIKFLDNSVGFIYGGNGILYKTTNGGLTWDQHFPGVSPGHVSGVTKVDGKIFIATGDYYYAYDAARALAVSSDEGETWTVLNRFADGSLYYVDFTHSTKGIVTGEHGLFRTDDNGVTWEPTTMGLPSVADLHFIDENNVIILSERDLYKSTDGGKTVRKVLTTEQTEAYLPAGKLYSFSGNVLFSVSWYAVYRSDDAGETWDLVSLNPAYYTQDLHFISPTTGFRVELFGSIERSTDGGKTWQRTYTRDPEASDVFSAVYFIDEKTGYSGGDFLQKTTDGGYTWQKIKWPFYEIIAIHFENESHGFVVTRGGTVYETTNAGATFETIFSHSTKVFDVQFINNEIYLVGEHGFAARLNTTPGPPPLPGYIIGPGQVCAGDAAEYRLSLNGNQQTHWTTTAGNIEDHADRATIRFSNPGEYLIAAKHFNSCGTSDQRSLSVIVTQPETPVIEGPASAFMGEENMVYTVSNVSAQAGYFWSAPGSSAIALDNNSVIVDWSDDVNTGEINVLTVDASGCRASATFAVELIEMALATEMDLLKFINLYPNPADADVHVASAYTAPLDVRVLDLLGREYSRMTLPAGEDHILSTHRLPAGLYLIEVSDGIRTNSKKLIRK